MAEHDDSDLKTGAKAAAAAAAVGAAVGVARAIASRAEEASRNGRDDSHDEDDQEVEPTAVHEDDEPEEEHEEEGDDEPVQATGVDELRGLTKRARTILQELSGADVEAVSAIARTADGWTITLETVELRRIPDSMDVMATYNVEVDGDGDLVRYERRRRYARAQSDHGGDA